MTGTALPALRLKKTDALEDGHTAHATDTDGTGVMFIGTRALPEHRAEARSIVRTGMADILAWLGEPVETTTGDHLYAQMRGIPVPEMATLPTSNRAIPGGSQFLRYVPPTRVDWSLAYFELETVTPLDVRTLTRQRFGSRHQLPPVEALGPIENLAGYLAGVIAKVYRETGEALREAGMVADVTTGYPGPELQIDLVLDAWPAVPGLTTPAVEDSP